MDSPNLAQEALTALNLLKSHPLALSPKVRDGLELLARYVADSEQRVRLLERQQYSCSVVLRVLGAVILRKHYGDTSIDKSAMHVLAELAGDSETLGAMEHEPETTNNA
jgi:hypothetical protein